MWIVISLLPVNAVSFFSSPEQAPIVSWGAGAVQKLVWDSQALAVGVPLAVHP